MKKVSFFAFCFISFASLAQTSIGIRGNFNGSVFTKFDLIENVTPDFKFLPSAGGGIFVEVPISSSFSVQPEINFVRKGFRVNESINSEGQFLGVNIPLNGRFDFRTNYLEIPVLAKVHLGDKEAAHYYLAAGPAIGFMADADMRMKLLNLFPTTINLDNGMFKPIEFSGVVAAGFELPVAVRLALFTEARYTYGFSRVLDTGVFEVPVRSRTLSGGLGLKVTL
jgi:hypothetical protein